MSRLAIVSHAAGLDGAERSLLATLESLPRKWTASVVLPRRGALVDELEARGVRYDIVPFRWWASRYETPSWSRVLRHGLSLPATLALAAVLHRMRCDLVFSNSSVVYSGALAARLLGVPHVWFVRELLRAWRFDPGTRVAAAVMRRTTVRFVANSEATRADLTTLLGLETGESIDLLYPPVAPPATVTPAAREPLRCLAIGALQPGKGQRDAIEAVGLLKRRGLAVHLELVGDADSSYGRGIRELVRRSELEGAVTLTGHRPRIDDALGRAEIVLVTARDEGFGRATAEAMLAGKAIVATRSGATPEMLGADRGVLVESGDIEALADAIASLSDTARRAKLGRTARAWAHEQLSLEQHARRLAQILEQTSRRS